MTKFELKIYPPDKLFDLKTDDRPSGKFVIFRTLQIDECGVCNALTNEVFGRGMLLTTSSLFSKCPHSHECWHHELMRKLLLLRKPHPKSYREELEAEIAEIRKDHIARNDLIGNPDLSQIRKDNVAWVKTGGPSGCRHSDVNDFNFSCTAKGIQLED